MNKYSRIFFGVFIVLLYSGNSFAGVPVTLYDSHAGNINYVTTGATLRTQSNEVNACTVTNSASATLSGIPATASIRAAYLYWAGSFSTRAGSTQTTPDNTVTFEGQTIVSDRMFLEDFQGTDEEYFCGFKDVTSIVTTSVSGGDFTFSLSGLNVNTATPHCSFATVVSGWALVVVYEDSAEDFRVINVFDGFEIYYGSEISLTPSNFQIPLSPINGKMTHISWEGDSGNSGSLNGFSENLFFNSNVLSDGVNPQNNQYNSTINTLGSSTNYYGVDIDTYDVSSYLSAGQTNATSRYSSGGDMVLLSTEIISVTNTSVVDLAIQKSHTGVFVVGQETDFTITVNNNGPDVETGLVTVTDTLPAGFTYVSSFGSGWTVDISGLPTVVWTSNETIPVGGALSPIILTVNVGAAAYPSISNTASVSSTTFDNHTGNNSATSTGSTSSLGVVKTSSAGGLVQAGDTVKYDFTLTNLDSQAHTNITVNEVLPPGASYIPESTSVTVSSQGTATFRDEFNARSYSNNNGTANWATNWLEINESDGATSNDEQVMTDTSSYVLQIQDNDGGGEGVQREVNLSGYDTATLSFRYRRNQLDNANDYVTIAISNNGGSSWTELGRFQGPNNDTGYVAWSRDISSYLSSNTRIRFLSSANMGNTDRVFFDDVEIAASVNQTVTYTNVAGDPNQLDNGIPPNLVTSMDGFSIQPGRTMTLSYQVIVDDPLDIGITQIETTSSIASNQTVSPITATVIDYVPHLSSYTNDYSTEDNLYYRDPANTGVGDDVIYVGGPGWVPGSTYDVAYYDGKGDLIFTDTTGTVDSSAFLTSSYDNSIDDIFYGTWTAVATTHGTSFQSDLPSELSYPYTILHDEFRMNSWSSIAFTDASGAPINGYDILGGSDRAYVKITDPDQNTNSNIAETITVSIQVTGSSSLPVSATDSETIVLTETGPDTGIFEYTFGMPISYSSGSSNDGILNVSGDDYLYVNYSDPDDVSDSSEVFAYVPTLAVLSSFKAYEEDNRVVVEWETVSEVGTLGFDLYRKDAAAGEFEKLNEKILPGLLVHSQGGTYRYTDDKAVSGETYTYKLIEKECRGKARVHGPFTVTVDGEGLDLLEQIYVRIFGKKSLHKLQSGDESLSEKTYFDQASTGDFKSRPRQINEFKKQHLKLAKVLREKYKRLKKYHKGTEAKICIQEKGIYFLAVSEIAEVMNLPINRVNQLIQKGKLSIHSAGKQVAWMKAQQDKGIYFYGEAISSSYTNQNIYWLEKGNGLNMTVLNDSVPDNQTQEEYFTDMVHAERNQWPVTGLYDDPEADFWIWDMIISSGPDQEPKNFPFKLAAVASVAGENTASITVSLKGGSDFPDIENDHHVEVNINGIMVGEGYWNGTDDAEFEFSFDQAILNEGDNSVAVKGLLDTGVPYSFFYVNAFDVTYNRSFTASGDSLFLTGNENDTITVNGFSTPDIMVFDVTRNHEPAYINSAIIRQDENDISVSFPSDGSSSKYFAVTADAVKKPVSFIADSRSNLRGNRNGADYIVISIPELEAGARALAEYRKQKGYTTKVVMLEDIFDEFNHGIASPVAIRDFLSYAYHNWIVPPRYVVLAGDGTYDYKDYQGHGDNLIPPFLISTPYGLFASDIPFADVEKNDGIPEIAIGRIPAITVDSFTKIIQKIERYESSLEGEWCNRIMMMADNPDNGGDFTADSDAVAANLPAEYSTQKIYLSNLGVSAARSKMFSGIQDGVLLINYLGHGAVSFLADEGLLKNADVPLFDNKDKLPIVAAMTCVAGRFSIPGYDSLGETLLMDEEEGAIAVWAPTGFSMNAHATILDQEFFKEIFQKDESVLGDAIQSSLINVGEKAKGGQPPCVYNLLGDPALQIKKRVVH